MNAGLSRLCWIPLVLAASPAAADPTEPAPEPATAVEVAPSTADAPVPAVAIHEPTGTFSIGAGYLADEGFLAQAEVRQNNLFHTGHQLSLSAELTERHSDARLRYLAPDAVERGVDLGAELFATRRAYTGFARSAAGGELRLGRWLDRSTRFDVRYRLEQIAVELDAPAALDRATAGGAARPPLGDGRIATLGAALVHDTLDTRFAPRAGTRYELSADLADPSLGSDARFLRVAAALDHARPLGPLTLRFQGRATYVRGLGGDAVPLSERLQHDGHADIRGYGFGTLAPTMAGVAGGRELEATGHVELEAPLIPRLGISIAAFADAGLSHNADPAWGPTGTTLARSVGVSLLWRSPIGPLRFDWAVPLDTRDHAPQFLFSLGAPF